MGCYFTLTHTLHENKNQTGQRTMNEEITATEPMNIEDVKRMKKDWETKHTLDVKRFPSLEEALAASCKKEHETHRVSKSYNEADYRSKCKRVQNLAKEWLVIDGFIYYVNEMTGSEKGLKLLNYFDMISCLHNAPFYKVDFLRSNSDRLIVNTKKDGTPQGFKRDLECRRLYAKHGWMMTTSSKIVSAFKKLT